MFLANGREVPDACVTALEELEQRWPGATFHRARGAIALAVIDAYEKEKENKA